MKLYIQIKNGIPFEHPIFEDNFKDAFPQVDVNNLPDEFAEFERVEAPLLGPYQKNQRLQYEIGDDGVCRDVWYCDEFSEEEKIAKQDAVKNRWNERGGFASWTFDEEACSFKPPAPYPQDGKSYMWDEATISWKEIETAL